ncbi:MAG TPA: asparagine synthase (glutamine-hydrolyzing) [Flavobacteriales bacterium]|nr:asparagine synthase (glutamine-hydrolyzing) [Flavobacteriales bacterium]
MCGISGYYSFTPKGKEQLQHIDASVAALALRGPDGSGIFKHNSVALGHARLSIIDVSNAASQPFTDETGRWTMVFNGEFFNFQEHREALEKAGQTFRSTSDTEVLLYLYIREKEACLHKINGFFAFAVYDNQTEELFIARDRYGERPLLIAQTEDGIAFASEMKSLLTFDWPRNLDNEAARQYFHLNYIPGPESIFNSVKKLQPGTWMRLNGSKIEQKSWYNFPPAPTKQDISIDYTSSQKELIKLLDAAVERRLISDVPLGAFLSGGIDSSVVVALASRHTNHLNTFSIGYKDEPLFDETKYARLVVDRYKTNHTVFSLSNEDLFKHLHDVLDYIDEPFADSSALAVYILSKETRKHVTVALSGDGADELFGGYRKHSAEWKMRQGGLAASTVKLLGPVWNALPKSRNSKLGDIARKLQKFSEGANLSTPERYWRWCGYSDEAYLNELWAGPFNQQKGQEYKRNHLSSIGTTGDMNDMLRSDMLLVLPGDMLTKVDMMSMANSLEVRAPFLDVEVVDFAMRLPADYKISGAGRKRLVQDAFRSMLPEELYNRPKHGFEVPLLSWFRNELNSCIFGELLSPQVLKEQGLFHLSAIEKLKKQLHSSDPGDSAAKIWALIVFQSWWKKRMK